MKMNERIRKIRTSRGLTQAQFGKELGIESSASWEKAAKPQMPTTTIRMLICEKYHVNPVWLETGEGEMFLQTSEELSAKIAKQYQNSVVLRSILTAYADLSEIQREAFDSFVDKFVQEYNNQKLAADEEPAREVLDAAEEKSAPPEKAEQEAN